MGGGPALTAHVTAFAVEDTTIQLTWRALHPGELRLRVADTDVAAEITVTDEHPAGGVVLHGLPAGQAVTVEAQLPGREGAVEKLAVRTLDPLPGEELSRIATVGDLHLGATRFGHRGTITEDPTPAVAHPVRCAAAAIQDAVGWGAERLVAKGDVTNHGKTHEWRTWAGLTRELPVPVDAIAGNHDRDHPGSAAGMVPDDAAEAFGLTFARGVLVRDLPGVRLVLADTTTPGRNRGTITPIADDLVDAVAEADPAGAVLVFLHHHLHPRTGAEVWPRGVNHPDSRDLLSRLGSVHPHVLVSSGHTHRHRRWSHAGVTTTQVGSTKDYPGVWAGYVIAEGGMRQVVRRITRPDCIAWTDHTRRAALGAWRFIAPGLLDSRCFDLTWSP